MNSNLEQRLQEQRFANAYELVDGVAMHEENGDRFQIPHDVLKKHIGCDQFVELRIDSPRFSVHEDAPQKCTCSMCNGEATKPILRHEQPASLVQIPDQQIPSRGWGEDFWVRVSGREGECLSGVVDNALVETRLHEIRQGDEIVFRTDHILAVHGIHRQELVLEMDASELKTLAQWISQQDW